MEQQCARARAQQQLDAARAAEARAEVIKLRSHQGGDGEEEGQQGGGRGKAGAESGGTGAARHHLRETALLLRGRGAGFA